MTAAYEYFRSCSHSAPDSCPWCADPEDEYRLFLDVEVPPCDGCDSSLCPDHAVVDSLEVAS